MAIEGSHCRRTGLSFNISRKERKGSKKGTNYHQEFQVPKMEGFLNLIAGYFGGGGNSPYISRIHTAYIGGTYLHFRYQRKVVVKLGRKLGGNYHQKPGYLL